VTAHPSYSTERPTAGCDDCDTTCDSRCACPGCTAPTVQLVRPVTAQPSPDLPASLRRDRKPAGSNPKQPAYDAVYAYIRQLGDSMPPDPVHRNAMIWRAVSAALDAVDRLDETGPETAPGSTQTAEQATVDGRDTDTAQGLSGGAA